MARPSKDGDSKRDRVIRVRFTAGERTRLFKIAEERGLTLSDFIRVLALNAVPLRRRANPYRAALIKGLAELGKIGSNVNQMARALNRRQEGNDDTSIPPDLITHALHGVNTLTNHLIKELTDGH